MTVTPPTALYRFFDENGVLLYVGVTDNLGTRWATHADQKHWWDRVTSYTLEWFDTREAAEAAEQHAIWIEKPLYNVRHTRSKGAQKRAAAPLNRYCTDAAMPKLVNLNGAAELLGVSPQYAHRLAERGQLIGAKFGASWMFRRAVVEKLDRQRRGETGKAPPAEA